MYPPEIERFYFRRAKNNFHTIDVVRWNRLPYFEHYTNVNQCTYSMTVDTDITLLLQELKIRGHKLYPAFIYMVTRVVNEREEFKTSYGSEGSWGTGIP